MWLDDWLGDWLDWGERGAIDLIVSLDQRAIHERR
jgi:hypothetical protein